MKKNEKQFYRVDLQILPEAIKKTIKVKELLNQGICHSINEAVKKVNISQSAYYKYKDHVAPAFEEEEKKFFILFLVIQDEVTLMSKILRRIQKSDIEIISLSHCSASKGKLAVTITAKPNGEDRRLDELTHELNEMKGIYSFFVETGDEHDKTY